MMNAGRGCVRVLATIAAIIVVMSFIVPPAMADTPVYISTQQTLNGKTYGLCFSGISVNCLLYTSNFATESDAP